MRLPVRARHIAPRVATGAYILHSGLDNRSADEQTAGALHGMAAGAYPMLRGMEPMQFVKLLSATEIGVGATLLSPFVPSGLAGAVLTGFSGGLVGMYARTPALRRPGSVWPSQQGVAVSKDVWMLGVGLGLLIDALTGGRRR